MERDLSPEERLLALIRGKEKRYVNDKNLAQKSDTDVRSLPQGSRGGRFDNLSKIFKSYIYSGTGPVRLSTLVLANRYLAAVLTIITLYLIIDIYINPYRNQTALISKIYETDATSYRTGRVLPSQSADYSSYAGVIANRKIFGQPPSSQTPPPTPPAVISDDITKELALVGIIAGENPQAIVENKKTQKVYYLNKGDSFDGFLVDGISDGKVLLDREGKKAALFL